MLRWLINKFVLNEIQEVLEHLDDVLKIQRNLERRINLIEESLKSFPPDIYDPDLINPDKKASCIPPGIPDLIFDQDNRLSETDIQKLNKFKH